MNEENVFTGDINKLRTRQLILRYISIICIKQKNMQKIQINEKWRFKC